MGKTVNLLAADPSLNVQRILPVADPSSGKLYKIDIDSLRTLLNLSSASYLGPATTTTNPGTPSGPAFYTASGAGTYTNFLDQSSTAIVVGANDGLVILSYDGSHWIKQIAALNLANYSLVADIKNNLTSTDTDKPLSAAQGKSLNDNISSLQSSFAPLNGGFNSIADVSSSVQDINVWTHSRGDTEIAGGFSYVNTNGDGIGIYEQIPSTLTFRKAKLPFFAGPDSVITIRCYKSASFSANVSSLTLLKELTFASGVFNTSSSVQPIVDFGQELSVNANEYVYFFIYATAGSYPSSRMFGTDSGSAPFRHRFLFLGSANLAAPWTSTYNISAGSNYQSTFRLIDPSTVYSASLTSQAKEDILTDTARVSGTDILGARVPSVQWQHSRGDSEMFGSFKFTNSAGNGVAIYKQMSTDIVFNKMFIPFCAGTDSAITLRLYKSSAFTANVSSMTLVKEVLFPAGTFNTVNTKIAEITLDTFYKILANEYLYIMVYSTAGALPTMYEFSTDSGTAPFRDHILFLGTANVNNPWGSTWSIGGASHWQASFKLVQIDPYITSLLPSSTTSARITIPATVYAVVGKQLSIYYDSIILSQDAGLSSPVNFKVEITGEVGLMDERRWYVTPVTADVGNHTLTINVYDKYGNVTDTKNFTLVVKAATGLGSVKNILDIGDSLTFAGTMTSTERQNFVDLGGTTPVFRGNHGSSPNNHEGIGGWKYSDFAGPGATFFNFTVSGVTTASVGSEYTNNGSTFRIEETNVTAGSGYIKCSRKAGTNDPTTSGTLTKSAWDGDPTISFSAWVLEPGNPLWNTSTAQLDIANYRTNLGMGSTKFDLVQIQLGVNDCNGSVKTEAQIQSIISSAKTIINAFITDNAATKIIIQLPTSSGNTNGGWATLYGAGNSKQAYMNAIWRLRELIITNFSNGAYNANVVVGPAGIALDRYWGYQREARNVGTRYTDTEQLHINSVHPYTSGYQQLGDARFYQMLALLS